ncbi:MAG: hypothetical protein K0R05_609 [Anaerocolumna sp.]|jgi:hypothetical protein|nr:hypothetical protein [Anaerocolumna sp.]
MDNAKKHCKKFLRLLCNQGRLAETTHNDLVQMLPGNIIKYL